MRGRSYFSQNSSKDSFLPSTLNVKTDHLQNRGSLNLISIAVIKVQPQYLTILSWKSGITNFSARPRVSQPKLFNSAKQDLDIDIVRDPRSWTIFTWPGFPFRFLYTTWWPSMTVDYSHFSHSGTDKKDRSVLRLLQTTFNEDAQQGNMVNMAAL